MDFKLIVLSGLLAIIQAFPHTSSGIASRIAGGQDAKIGEFPYLVSLAWEMPPIAKLSHTCGGAILNANWILTTANCVYLIPTYGSFMVKAGKHRLDVDESGEQIAIVEKRTLHENFNAQSAANNIALLKLKKPLKLNANVAAIKLPQANSGVTGNVTVAGWGVTSVTGELAFPTVLQKLTSTLFDIRDCQRTYNIAAGNVSLVSNETNFCTATLSGQSVCLGDTGAPLIINEVGKAREIVGLVSFMMHPCTFLNLPQVHVKVSSYVDWIQNKIHNDISY